MADAQKFDVQVVGPDDYAVMIMVDNDGRASMRSAATPEYVGELLTRMTGRFYQTQGLPLSVPGELAEVLSAAGWTPPFNPADHQLSDHDFMELVVFAGSVESEGFGYAAEEYPPRFKDEALASAIDHAPLDRLKKLLTHHQTAVDEFWERDDAGDLVDAHQAKK